VYSLPKGLRFEPRPSAPESSMLVITQVCFLLIVDGCSRRDSAHCASDYTGVFVVDGRWL